MLPTPGQARPRLPQRTQLALRFKRSNGQADGHGLQQVNDLHQQLLNDRQRVATTRFVQEYAVPFKEGNRRGNFGRVPCAFQTRPGLCERWQPAFLTAVSRHIPFCNAVVIWNDVDEIFRDDLQARRANNVALLRILRRSHPLTNQVRRNS
jgi:hypothetical protein